VWILIGDLFSTESFSVQRGDLIDRNASTVNAQSPAANVR
jgi:hypothetical protein